MFQRDDNAVELLGGDMAGWHHVGSGLHCVEITCEACSYLGTTIGTSVFVGDFFREEARIVVG